MEGEAYECQVEGTEYKKGRVKSKDDDNFLFKGKTENDFTRTIAKNKCRLQSKTKKKSVVFRDLNVVPLTDTVLFDKEQAPIAIGSTRSVKQDAKDAVNWGTYKPTLRVYSLKTVMDDKFEYYVRINSVFRPSSTLFTWNCTLLQPTDGDTHNINVSFPPPTNDPKELAFWNNLQLRRSAMEKQDACKKEADELILSMNHELELMESGSPSSSPSSSPSTSSRKKMNENDYFHAQVICDSNFQTLECLEGTQKGGNVFRVTGKVIQITQENITIELYAIESFNRLKPEDQITTKQYTIKNDPQLLIWRSYERFIQNQPLVGEQFQSQIACNITAASTGLGSFSLACLRKDKDPIRDVLGTVKEISGNTMTVSLFLKEDTIQPLYYGDGDGMTSKTDFKLDYNPKYPLWKHYSRLEEDGSQQLGTVPVTLRDVSGNGDCFFYALFQALSNRNLVQKLTPTLPKNKVENVDKFIVAFRRYLADNLDSKLTMLVQSLKNEEEKTFNLKIQGLSTPFQNTLKSSATLVTKLTELKKAVTTRGTYVSEPEVELTKEFLTKLGIFLDIKNNITKTQWNSQSNLYNLNEQRIVLVNIDENHYNWYKFPAKPTQGGKTFCRRPRRRRTLRRR